MSAVDDDRRKVSRAIAWVGLASGVVGALDAITLAILVWQWVTPEQFGIASLAATLFFLLDLITDAGLSSVLIQRESVDDDTLSSVFWLNVMVTAGAFVVVLGLGPLVGYIQGYPIVGWMLIVYGTKLLYQNVYFIPAALLRREMRFRELSIVRTIANLGEAIAKLGFAAAGEPIWCFVAGPLARVFITGIGLQICRPWRPRRVFRTDGMRSMLSFGAKTTGSQFLQHFYTNITHQIVGFYFSEAAVGAYRIAYEIVLYPINWVSNVVAQVAFPAFARLRGKSEALSAQFLAFSRQNLAVAIPILVLLLVAADDFIALAFPKIGDISTPVRVLCVVGLLRAIDCLYLPLLDAMGLAGRNVVVASFATVLLTTLDIVFAATLGDELGFTAVAVARTVGYPLVILAHARMALGPLGLSAGRYLGHLIGIIGCGVGAVAVGLAIHQLLPDVPSAVALASAGGGALAVLALLLAKTQGLGIRRAIKELRR